MKSFIKVIIYLFGLIFILFSFAMFSLVDENGNHNMTLSIILFIIFMIFGILCFVMGYTLFNKNRKDYNNELAQLQSEVDKIQAQKNYLLDEIDTLKQKKEEIKQNYKWTIEYVDNLSGEEFEKYVGELLEKLGYTNINVTKLSNDYGIDVLAEKENIKYAFQCKHYNSVLGNKCVQETFSGKQYYNCHVGIVITNNYFSPNAKELADNNGILLWDRDKLIALLNNISSNKETSIIGNDEDPLYDEIVEFAIQNGVISASLIQRKFRTGYNRAARLIDILEEKGIIGPANGAKPHEVLINKK